MNSSILVKTHRQKTNNSPSESISNHFEAASNDILELQLSCSFQNLEIWKVVKRKFPYFGRWQRWTVPVFSHPKPWWKLICLQDKNYICERLRDQHCFIFRYKQFWIYFRAKSLERSPAVGDFYWSGIEIWAGFGPVRQLLRPVFSCFHGQKNFFKNILDGENIFGIEWNKKIYFFFLKKLKKKFRLRHIFNCVLPY